MTCNYYCTSLARFAAYIACAFALYALYAARYSFVRKRAAFFFEVTF